MQNDESYLDSDRYEGDVGNGCEGDEREAVDSEEVCGPKINKTLDVNEVGERICVGQNFASMETFKDDLVDMTVKKLYNVLGSVTQSQSLRCQVHGQEL